VSNQINVLQHRFEAYQEAVKILMSDHQSVPSRKAALQIRDEFVSDMPLLIADALTSYRSCQRGLARSMVARLADKQLTVRSTIESLAKAGWLSSYDATAILATLPKPVEITEHSDPNGNPIDGYPLQQA
jgi:predicted YcjX-like family ATPase